MQSRPERWDAPVDRVGRRTLLRAGLTTGFGVVALGAAGLVGARAPAPAPETRSFLRQPGWRHCKNCQGLSYADALTSGRCPNPKDNVPYHRADGSLEYLVSYSTAGEQETADRQHLWRHCKRCQGLAYNGQGLLGWCPAGGHHDHTGSFDYFLWHGDGRPYTHSGWRFCDKCMAIFYGPAETASACGKSGQHHAARDPHPSFPYLLEYDCKSSNGCR